MTANHYHLVETKYHYLTISPAMKKAIHAEAEVRGLAMAALAREGLFVKPLNLEPAEGPLDTSLGIRVTDKELELLELRATKRGLARADYERCRLFKS